MGTLRLGALRPPRFYGVRCFYLRNLLRLILYGTVLAAFVCQIHFRLSDYLQRRTFMTTEEITDPPAPFPPFTVCPWPSFNPFRLMNLGLNSSVATGRELACNYENLIGVDDGMPGERLVNEAAWRLEELVEEVMVGDVHEVYNTTNASSLLWQRTFNPIGPCLTLTPQPLSSLSSKSVMVKLRQSDLERCKWKENGVTRFYGGPEDCPLVRKYCNTSCAWEQFIKDEYFKMTFLYLGSTSTALNIHYASTDMRIPYKAIEVYPYHIVRFKDTEIPSKQCFHGCILRSAERKLNCKGLSQSTAEELIRSLCIRQSQQYALEQQFKTHTSIYRHCRISCKPDKREFRWVLADSPADAPYLDDVFVLNLSSGSFKAFNEKEVYPLSEFLSDAGGSLGLFLGISLLSMWEVIVSAAKSIRGAQSDTHLKSTYLHLTTLSGEVAISMAACTHLALVLFEYKYQTLNTEVTLQENIADSYEDITKNFTASEDSVRDLVIAHIASRPLGCQVIPPTSELGCFVRCILHSSKKISVPLKSTDDLPLCTQDHLSIPKKKYIVSSQISEHFMGEEVKFCSTKCRKSERSAQKKQPFINVSIEKNFEISKSSLISTVGGIIGLYYGFSLFHILPSSDSVSIISKSTYNISKLAVQVSISFAGILLTMLQVQSFLLDHPVTTSYSSRRLEGRDLPAFTVCVWPPFNMERILEEAGFKGAYEQTLNMTSPDKHASILSLLQKLSETQNSTRLDHLWSLGDWSYQEVEITVRSTYQINKCLECQKNINDFNSCHTYIQEYSGEAHEGINCNIIVSLPRETKAILSIHSRNDLPVTETDAMVNPGTIYLDRASHWSGLQGDTRGWGKCVSQCLDNALRQKMGCVLPWSASRGSDPVCTVDQYIELLGDLWSPGSHPQHIYSAQLGSRVTNACKQKCHQKSGIFFSFTINGEEHITPSFTMQLIPSYNSQLVFAEFVISTETLESVSEHDGYPVSQLLCDIGGIAGMTVGFSLISLIDVIWGALTRK